MKQNIEKVLIANRGEIALRIISTLKEMGIKSVAVYSEADTNSLHVQEADEAYYIGNSPAPESYLSIPKIISAAKSSGAQAVHPGYGFLSENYKFAQSLNKEGITLIGPSSQAIKLMGDKVEAKKIAKKSGVNTVPGYMGFIDSKEQALEIAKEIGLPVVVKAAAGGGGRGMRVVYKEEEMEAAYNSSKSEAEGAFNDGRLFIEKYIIKPRHIEIQVLGDNYGNIVCLGERECSIQRNHQKIIEEAPSPIINEKLRQELYRQSVLLAREVNYISAGTVEYILDQDHNFYFLEMNTRLQVEHPVTELITGIDIVKEMINIANGKELPFKQSDIKLNGSAIECRICAEDPSRGFLPSVGRITEYIEPAKTPSIRIDSGVYPGFEVSMFYDPMIVKLCSYGKDRNSSIESMQSALGKFVINGIYHNLSFLEAILHNENFITSNIHTGFLSQEFPQGKYNSQIPQDIENIFIATILYIFLAEQKRAYSTSQNLNSQNNSIGTRWIVNIENQTIPVITKFVDNELTIRTQNSRLKVKSDWNIGRKLFFGSINGKKVNVKISNKLSYYTLSYAGISVKISVRSLKVAELDNIMQVKVKSDINKEIYAPLTGQVLKIFVNVGDKVKKQQELLTLSAMKMENIISSESEGIIKKIHVNENDNVNMDKLLIEFE